MNLYSKMESPLTIGLILLVISSALLSTSFYLVFISYWIGLFASFSIFLCSLLGGIEFIKIALVPLKNHP